VRRDGHHGRRAKCSEDAQHGDRNRRRAKAAPADVHASVEEDDDQGDDGDSLDILDRESRAQPRKKIGRDRGGEEEQRRSRNRKTLGQFARCECNGDRAGYDKNDQAEIRNLGQVPILPANGAAGPCGTPGNDIALSGFLCTYTTGST
jgi:hypothetical protein